MTKKIVNKDIRQVPILRFVVVVASASEVVLPGINNRLSLAYILPKAKPQFTVTLLKILNPSKLWLTQGNGLGIVFSTTASSRSVKRNSLSGL